nr:Gag-Pol polyprotein [Tanacetum cinerariifolium]
MKDKVMQNNSQVMLKKKEVEDHHRISSFLNKTKSVTACNDSLDAKTLNVKFVCVTCDKCVFNSNHDDCVSKYINDVNAKTKKPHAVPVNLSGNDPLMGIYGSDLYTTPLHESSFPTPICFMAKASTTQVWLWHQRLSHLDFDTINLLSKNDIVNGLPKPKFVKDHICSSCELGKTKRSNVKIKITPSSKGRLDLLQMDLCGLMHVQSINEKKYILVIFDDYSRYTWTHFLRFKDETPEENNTNQAIDAQFDKAKFINPSATPVTKVAESSLRNLDTLKMHTFYQSYRSNYHWTKDHPLEQVRRNLSKPVQTKCQLATDLKMCMFTLTMSTAEPKNIKETMADHAWIEDEDNIVIHNKARLVAKRHHQDNAFGWHLEKIHVTWTQFGKKRDKIATLHEEAQKLHTDCRDGVKISSDVIRICKRRRDENPIRTLGDYSRPSHEGYRNAIELLDWNNVVPLQFDTMWLVQNGCAFYGLRSEDPNQHLKDFLKLVDSLDLDVANRERKCMCLF